MIKELTMEKTSLPVGWEMKTLGDISDFQRGLTYSRKDAVDFSENIVLRATNIDLDKSCLDFSELKYLNNDFQVKQNKKIVKGGLLICLSSGSKKHLGKVALVTDEYNYAFGGFIGQIIPDNQVVSKYLFYNLVSEAYKKYISELTDGIGINNLKSIDLKSFEIPLPPLPQQKQIVALLDKAFAAIDTAKANAEQNLQNAKELFESYFRKALSNKNWLTVKLGEACEKVEYGSSTKSSREGLLPVLRMGNIQNRRLVWNDLKYSNNKEDNDKYLLKYNDVLFNRTNSPEWVGKTAIYKGEMPAIFAGYLIRIIRKEDLLDADYLNYYLNSQIAKDYGDTVVISSVNQANINGTKLKSYPIPLPDIETQKQIVQKLDSLSIECEKLEAIYTQKIADLEEMKKSVLQKAFSGQLNTIN
ncbi:MAG: type I restriction enzyme S subunit [Candidatus Paceibacteria bacterium]|jgi:type I restriction enzyme S subunit